jgi:hypothetical protein
MRGVMRDAILCTMYVKQCDCLKPCLWTTTFVDDRTSMYVCTLFSGTLYESDRTRGTIRKI